MTVDGATTSYTYNNLDRMLTAGPTTTAFGLLADFINAMRDPVD